jgi:microcystin-dependent protein
MSEMYIGQLLPFGGANFVIKNTATANGALVSISQNTALFSILGTTYGGNGVQTFALPNLTGRAPFGFGTASTGSTYFVGQVGGTENVTLTQGNLPAHTHGATTSGLAVDTSGLTVDPTGISATLRASNLGADSPDPAGSALAQSNNNTSIYLDGGTPNTALAANSVQLAGTGKVAGTASVSGNVTVGLTGNNIPVATVSPYLVINWLVVTYGIFPSRE